MSPDTKPAKLVLESLTAELRRHKERAEKAMAQVQDDASLHATLDPESNSIAILVRHLSGNMLSRWTDFLTSDGEKPTRDRDGEFTPTAHMGRAELLAEWERGWACLFQALAALGPEDLGRTVTIRGKSLTAAEAVVQQFSHYAAHAGQIVFLAKHLTGEGWQTLSVPRKK